jgi:hypothetical protein
MLQKAQTRACCKDNGNSRAFIPLAAAGEGLGWDADCYRRNTPLHKTIGIDSGGPLQAAGMLRIILLFPSRAVAKAKSPSARPSVPSRSRTPVPNPRLDLQTRKVLQKHYRARHGVK